jgi:long-subunit fatty acid transport protein
MNTIRICAILLIALFAVPCAALADEAAGLHPWLTSKYGFDIGVFFPDRSNLLRASGSIDFDPGPTPFVDFGSELRLRESDSTFSAEFTWNFGKRWSMRMQYFDSTGSSTALLEEDVEWEDLVFLAGTNASAGSGFELTRFVWSRTMDNSPVYDLELSAGFHWLHVSAFIEGTIETPTGSETAREASSVDAPLPNIGFAYTHSLSPNWAIRTRFDWFNADVHPYDGVFINASAGINFALNDRLNIGANYNYVELDVGVNGDNWRGEIETRYDGIYVYVGATW